MMPAVGTQSDTPLMLVSIVSFVFIVVSVMVGYRPWVQLIRRQEYFYDAILRGQLLIDISPRMATVLSGVGVAMLAMMGRMITRSVFGAIVFGAIGLMLPSLVLRFLRKRRLDKLENQLVAGIQTLSSGVRAGLNLVQAMEMVARDGPVPMRQEFMHMVREYEFGVALEEVMNKAATRIGSGDYRLLFSALQTHRERGGDLAATLDRIGESIREIQRLESRVQTLTAQGRATARWLGLMPVAVLGIMYLLVDSNGVMQLFKDDYGRLILAAIILLNVAGFLWIRKIMAVDI